MTSGWVCNLGCLYVVGCWGRVPSNNAVHATMKSTPVHECYSQTLSYDSFQPVIPGDFDQKRKVVVYRAPQCNPCYVSQDRCEII